MSVFRAGSLLLVLGATVSPLIAQESPFPKPESNAPTNWTESPIKPEISGFVRAGQSKSGPGSILVRLETSTGTMLQQAWTGNLGEFSFPEIACGNYVLAVDAPGYKSIRVPVEHSYIPAGAILLHLVPAGEDGPGGALVPVRQLNIPERARKEYDRGTEALAKKKPRDSIAHFRKAIQLYPDYDDAYLQLGWAQLQQRAYADAQQTLEQALQHNQKNPATYALLGTVHKQQNRLPQAAQALQQALSLQESFWRAHLELSEVLLKLGQVEQAYPHVARAHELNPALASIHLQLYNTLILRNDYAAAVAELEEFLKLFPEHVLVPRVRQQRDALRAKLQPSE